MSADVIGTVCTELWESLQKEAVNRLVERQGGRKMILISVILISDTHHYRFLQTEFA